MCVWYQLNRRWRESHKLGRDQWGVGGWVA